MPGNKRATPRSEPSSGSSLGRMPIRSSLVTTFRNLCVDVLVVFGTGGSCVHLDPYQVRVAMYGFETIHFLVPNDMRQPVRASHVQFGAKRRMTPDHNTSISAVATFTTPRPGVLDLRVFHNEYAAVPLPVELFARYGVQQYRLGKPRDRKAPQWEELYAIAP
jgi:hypothetical protein